MTTGNPNAPGFFKGGTTGGSRGASPEDLYVVSGAVSGQNLVLTLSNSTNVTISLGTVFADAGQITGLSYDSNTDRLTINQGGHSISTTIETTGNTHVAGISFDTTNYRLTATYNDGTDPITADFSAISTALDAKQDNLEVNSGSAPTDGLDTLGINGVTYRVSGSTPVHATLRTSLSLSPSSIQLPRLGTVVVTGTVSASLDNPSAGDVINDVTINSVHSSYQDGRTSISGRVSDTSSRFTWNYQVGDPIQTVTFTVSFSVNYVVDGASNTNHFTREINLPIIAEPQHYWTGTVDQANLNLLTASLADNRINSIVGITRRDNFTSPFTLEYNGGAVGSTPSLYPVLIVDQSIMITSLRTEGFSVSLSSFNDSTTGRTIYTTEAFLSAGPHNLTWRTG